jgi:regulator of replication initiation timing
VHPDSPETRIGRLEQLVARLEQRVEDQARAIEALKPLAAGQAAMQVDLARMQSHLGTAVDEARAARKELRQLRDHLEENAEKQRKERKTDRRWLVGTVLSSAALIIAAVQVLGGLG